MDELRLRGAKVNSQRSGGIEQETLNDK